MRSIRANTLISLIIYSIIGFVILALIFSRELYFAESAAHIGRVGLSGVGWFLKDNDNLMGIITLIMAIGLLLYSFLQHGEFIRRKKVRIILDGLLLAMLFFSSFVYFYGTRGVALLTYVKLHDYYHYYLGPKYFNELGHFDLYECTVLADYQTARLLKDSDSIRDLRTYEFTTVKAAREAARCEDNFSDNRWKDFKKDISNLKNQFGVSRYGLLGILGDHGYNGTPFYALVAGHIANYFPLTYRSAVLSTIPDIVGLLVMFMFLSWSFGWRFSALIAIFFFNSFVDRYYFIGGSFLRYYWMISLGIAVALLHRRKYISSSVLFAVSAMLNIFPVLFSAGALFSLAIQSLKARTILPSFKKFFVGFVATSLFAVIISLAPSKGIKNYETFFSNISVHKDLITTSRIGFRFNFLYRGEVGGNSRRYPLAKKIEELRQLSPTINFLALFFITAIFLASTKLVPYQASVLIGLALFFYLFGTVEYYYALTPLIFLLFYNHRHTKSGLMMFAALYMIMSLTYLALHKTGLYGLCNNTVLSAGLTIYLTMCIVFILTKNGNFKLRFSGFISLVCVFLTCAVFYISYITYSAAVQPFVTVSSPIKSEILGSRSKIVFGGDLSLARRQHLSMLKNGPKHALQLPILREADLAIVNLESVVASSGEYGVEKGEGGSYYFRARPEMLSVLYAAGIDVVATANNHSGDYGSAALLEQGRHLDSMNLGHAGSGENWERACSPVFRRAGRLGVAIFSIDSTMPYFTATKKRPGGCYLPLSNSDLWKEHLLPRIKDAREDGAALVLVAVHWGDNYRDEPSLQKRLIGQAIIEAGADAVLGSSAHMLQGVEVYRGRPIIHDAGNLLFDFSDVKTRKSGVFSLAADNNGIVALEFYPVLSEPGFSVQAKDVLAREIIREMITKSKRLGTVMQASDRETAILALPKLPVRSALGRTIPPNPTIRPAPAPRSKPPLGCVIKSVPEEVAIDPIQIGPFQLVGLRVHPELITERQILWVESFWQVEKTIDREYLFDIRAVPFAGSGMPSWRGVHQPCDWTWPTSRWSKGTIYRDFFGLRPPRASLENGEMKMEVVVSDDQGRRIGVRQLEQPLIRMILQE